MAAPDPAVVERQMYVDMHLGGVDDPSFTLADLRSLGGGASHVNRAAVSGTSENAANAVTYTSDPFASGTIALSEVRTVYHFLMLTNTVITMSNDIGVNGDIVTVIADGAFDLTINGVLVPTGEATLTKVEGKWYVRPVPKSTVPDDTDPYVNVLVPYEPIIDNVNNRVIIPTDTLGFDYFNNELPLAPGSNDIATMGLRTISAVPKAGKTLAQGVIDPYAAWQNTFVAPSIFAVIAEDTFTTGTAVLPRAWEVGGAAWTWTLTDTSTGGTPGAFAITGGVAVITSANLIATHASGDVGTTKQAIECNYDFSSIQGTNTSTEINHSWKASISLNASWGSHWIEIGNIAAANTQNTSLVISATGDASVVLTPVGGANLNAQPLTGKFRAETDGTTITVLINDVIVATAPRSDITNPAWAGSPTKLGFQAQCLANEHVRATKVDNVKIWTRP